MKKALLVITLVGTTFLAGAQKKVTARTVKQFDVFSTLLNADSSSYTYASYQGALTQNKPFFQQPFSQMVWQPIFVEPEIKYSTQELYYGISYPLTLNEERQKRYENGTYNTLADSSITYGNRTVYTYTSFNAIASVINQYDNMGTWETSSQDTYQYDAQNRMTRYEASSFNGTAMQVYMIDSIFYTGNETNATTIAMWTTPDGVTFDNQSTSVTSYTAGKPTSLEYYQGGVYSIYGEYKYGSDNLVDTLIAFQVVANVPVGEMGRFEYTYDANGNLTQEVQSGFSSTVNNYTYDADGFLSLFQESYSDGSTRETRFYYQDVAGLNEINFIQVSVYPNPTTGNLVVEAEATVKAIQLFDMNGRLLLEQNSPVLNIDHLNAGTYQLMVISENGISRQHVVKN